MSSRVDYFFRQRVSEAELDLGFALLEQADRNLAGDIGIFGIIDGMIATEHAGVPDFSVDLTAPGRAYDQLGRRIFFGAAQTVDLSVDLNGVPTAVQTEGSERIVSLFIQFDRLLSDPRTDGNSQQVFFRRDESHRFVVRQGAEAPAGSAAAPPLQPDALLVVDVTRRFGQAQILNSDLSPDPTVPGDRGRRQVFVFAEASAIGVFTGGFETLAPVTGDVQAALQDIDAALTEHFGAAARRHAAADIDAAAVAAAPNALAAGTVEAHLAALLAHLNDHENAPSGAHAAAAISYAGGAVWADGTQNPATTAQGQLDKLVADLGGTSGAAKIGAAAVTGTPHALAAGSVGSHLGALLGYVNAHESATAGAHAAAAIACAAGPAWRGGRANPAATVQDQLGKLVTDLGAQADGDDGACRIGAQAVPGTPTSLPAGSVRSHIDALLALANRAGLLDLSNAWAAPQAFQGTASGIEPALEVTGIPSTRRLALALRGTDYQMRLYHADRHLEVTLNARWNGTAWERESGGFFAARLLLGRSDVRYQQVDTSTPLTFPEEAWSGATARVFALDVAAIGAGQEVTSGRERDVSAGPLTGYSGVQGEWGSTNANLGGGASFASGRLPAAPSSVTFTVKQQSGTDGSPTAFAVDRTGVGWFDGTTGALPANRYMFLTFSAI